MKEEIDWKKEILASGRFNNKFSRNLLEHGAKNYCKVSTWVICMPDGGR